MRADELIRHGQHVMTVCNACRYCEGYCAVWPAMELRRTGMPFVMTSTPVQEARAWTDGRSWASR